MTIEDLVTIRSSRATASTGHNGSDRLLSVGVAAGYDRTCQRVAMSPDEMVAGGVTTSTRLSLRETVVVTTSDNGARQRPRFRKRVDPVVGAADPESLFGELPRTPNGVGALWSHQADQLRTYAEEHQQTSDVALELPTGSGKTLVGLLISEWRRRTLGQRIVYACPTKQLARQVLNKAKDQGIPVVLLIGSRFRFWSVVTLFEDA